MSAVASHQDMQDLISARELGQLFRKHLGWDKPRQEPLHPGFGTPMTARPVASKRAVDVWRVPCPAVPMAPERHKIIRRIRKLHSLEMLVVFDGDDGNMLWLWPEQRPAGDSYRAVAHGCERDAVHEEMLDRLAAASFTLDEEEGLTVSDVLSRVRRSLGVDIADLDREVERAVLDAALPMSGNAGCSARVGRVLSQEGGEQSNRMAAAIMFNAVVFQHHIASHHPGEVCSLEEVRSTGCDKAFVAAGWDAILAINYWPIFGIARKLLDAIGDDVVADAVLGELYGNASDKVAHRATQGLVGELFGRLIVDRKFLATYYTRPQSASFLAEMAVDRLDVDWADPEAVTSLRVADLACGTGALLLSAYRRIAARHEDAGGDPAQLHKKAMEEVLTGCDIMPAAVHLTASVLSGEHTHLGYRGTKTWVMPFGVHNFGAGPQTCLGSLDLLSSNRHRALFGDGSTAVGAKDAADSSEAVVPDKTFHLVIMNPPFTRPTNHENKQRGLEQGVVLPNPAFAGMDNDDKAQKLMSKALGKAYRDAKVKPADRAGDGNAGLPTNFVDLAHRKLRPGGVLAVIVPVAIVTGKSWEKTRQLLAKHYEDIEIVTMASMESSTTRAFSDDTNMAEAIIVATKRHTPVDPDKGRARYICLLSRPATNTDGVDIVRAAAPGGDFDAPGGSHAGFAVPGLFTPQGGGHPSGVASAELCDIAASLAVGDLRLPGVTGLADIPTVPLQELGFRGPVHRDINEGGGRGPYEVTPPEREWRNGTSKADKQEARNTHAASDNPVLWSHDADMETRMVVLPCSTGTVRSDMDEQAQKLRDGYTNKNKERIAGATRLHISTDFQVNSQPLGACLTPAPTLGGRAWPSFSPDPPKMGDPEAWEKALCVWLNSTLGLVGRWWVSVRQQKGRANLTITTIGRIPALNLRAATPAMIGAAAEVFDKFKDREFLPANEAHQDPARRDLDEALAKRVLHLPADALAGLTRLRDLWCREPSVHGNKPTRPDDS